MRVRFSEISFLVFMFSILTALTFNVFNQGIETHILISNIIVVISSFLIGSVIKNKLLARNIDNSKTLQFVKFQTYFLFKGIKTYDELQKLTEEYILQVENKILNLIENDVNYIFKCNFPSVDFSSMNRFKSKSNSMLKEALLIKSNKEKDVIRYFKRLEKIEVNGNEVYTLYNEFLEQKLFTNKEPEGISLFLMLVSIISFSFTIYFNFLRVPLADIINSFIFSPFVVLLYYFLHFMDDYQFIMNKYDVANALVYLRKG